MMSLKLFRNIKNLTLIPNLCRNFSSNVTDSNENKSPKFVEMIDFDDSKTLPIPLYPEKINEPLEVKKARLTYQARKRGMLENDLILSTFASKYLKTFDENQTALFDKLINQPTNDWDIYYWATGNKETPAEYDNEIMNLLKLHVSNPDKEPRFHQPKLY